MNLFHNSRLVNIKILKLFIGNILKQLNIFVLKIRQIDYGMSSIKNKWNKHEQNSKILGRTTTQKTQ